MTDTPKRSFPVWLTISLVVNALLLGLFIGGGIGNRRDGGGSQGISGGEAQLAIGIQNAMTAEERSAFRRAIGEAYLKSRDKRSRLNATRVELSEVLVADPYDQAAVEAAFERLRLADVEVKVSLHEEMAGQLGKLSLEQRQAILKSLSDRRRPARSQDGEGRDGRRGQQRDPARD